VNTFEQLTAAGLPLLVAFFNLLIAGHSLAGARSDRARLIFGAAPAGVGVWSLAWFLSMFDVAAVGTMQTVGSFGGVLAASGFALDGLWSLERRLRQRVLLAAAALTVALCVALVMFATRGLLEDGKLILLGGLPRLLAVVLTALVGLTGFLRARSTEPDMRRLGRRVSAVFGVATIGFTIFAATALIQEKAGVDPLLWVVLVAEATALVYVIDRQIEMHILLSRVVTSALLAMAVVGFSLLALWGAGTKLDAGLFASATAIALFAGLLFLGLGEVVQRGVTELLFPAEARLGRALEMSRGEVATLRRRLERVERLAIAGELAASVAHEIKNPLSPIRGYAQILSGKLESVSEQERPMFSKGLGIIINEADRIDQRVRDLLELARGERTPAKLDATADLHRVVLDVIAVAEGEPSVREVRRWLDASIGKVSGDADELRGALANVMKNAAEAMEPLGGGSIEVRTHVEGDRAIVEVLDEGVGLEGADESRAFDTFYTTKRGGTGLGLAIGRSAIDAAGGRIALEARSDRRGAKVRIELPLALAPKEGTA